MLIKLHDRLRPDAVAEYDEAHRAVPDDVLEGIRGAGVSDWTIWREGVDLFQLIECVDWNVTSRILAETTPPAWSARMGRLVDPTFVSPGPQPVSGAWKLREGSPVNFI